MRRFNGFLMAGALGATAMSGSAAMAQAIPTDDFTVQIVIEAGCAVFAGNTLDFGTAAALFENVDATTTFTVQCTDDLPYHIALDLEGTETATTRLMNGPGGTIAYELHKDTAAGQLWAVGGADFDATADGTVQTYTVFGRVLPQPTPAIGTYTDTVTVTVTF